MKQPTAKQIREEEKERRKGSEGMREAMRDGGILLLPLLKMGFGAEQQLRSFSTHARAHANTHTHTHTH